MTCNIGTTGRLVRIIAGLAIVGAGIHFHSWWGTIGLLPVTIGTSGYCPLHVVRRADREPDR